MLIITNTDQNVVITPVLTLAECDEQLVCSRERVCQLACFGMMPSTIYFCIDLQKGKKKERDFGLLEGVCRLHDGLTYNAPHKCFIVCI